MEQLTSFFSNPNPRIRIPEVKINNQESTKIRRMHIQGQETSLNVKLSRSIVRREMRWARRLTPRRWIVALRTCIPMFGNTIVLGRSMAVTTPRSRTGTGRAKLGMFHLRDPRYIGQCFDGRHRTTRMRSVSPKIKMILNGQTGEMLPSREIAPGAGLATSLESNAIFPSWPAVGERPSKIIVIS